VQIVIKLADSARRPPQFVNGGHGSFSVVAGACAPSYLQVPLAPLGAFTLLHTPVDELTSQLADLRDVAGDGARLLAERVRDAPTWDARFRALDQYLLGRAEDGPRPAPEVAQAWHRLLASGGATPIGRIATEVGWSHKHLITKFRRQVGLTPKTVARLIRFDLVWRRVGAAPRQWGQIAAESGYADQAHLVRECRAFTGLTPTELVGPDAR
jgi:AraC-like DNA-binding protein